MKQFHRERRLCLRFLYNLRSNLISHRGGLRPCNTIALPYNPVLPTTSPTINPFVPPTNIARSLALNITIILEPHTLSSPMPLRIRIVGGEYSDQNHNSDTHHRSWTFYQSIDMDGIHVGANIAILKYHPLHQQNLDPSLPDSTLYAQSVLLEGTVLGIGNARAGVVTFVITDDFTRELTTIRIPARATTISPSGGWVTKAKLIRRQRGLVFRYPSLIRAQDLQPPSDQRRPVTARRTRAPRFAGATK